MRRRPAFTTMAQSMPTPDQGGGNMDNTDTSGAVGRIGLDGIPVPLPSPRTAATPDPGPNGPDLALGGAYSEWSCVARR